MGCIATHEASIHGTASVADLVLPSDICPAMQRLLSSRGSVSRGQTAAEQNASLPSRARASVGLVESGGGVPLTVKTLSGQRHHFVLHGDARIHDVKSEVSEQEGLPVERIHLETCSGAYFVRPSDHQVIEGIDEGELAYRTNGETATLLKTLATQVPLDVLHAEQMASMAEANATLNELDAFDARVGGGRADDSDDE